MNVNWNYPTAVRVGPGQASEIAETCREFSLAKPLLVTDPGLAPLPMTREIIERCECAGLGISVFSDIKPNPTGKNITDGLQGDHDGVIALGGGSGLDAGKAIAVMAHQRCDLWQLEDIGDNWLNADPSKIPPIIAIPTTAGTGSEVGRASVIVNEESHKKAIIFHPKMLPDCVLLDPTLTIGLPPHLTAATGMDALSHNLEAFCSPVFHPMAEGIAIEGMRRIKAYLPEVFSDGTNIEARQQMLVASSMGATAFQRGLGGMHALAHPLGALYDTHHGLLNAVLMPYVLNANRSAIAEPIARLARYLELPASLDGLIQWILDLRQSLDIPHRLSEIGIDHQRVEEIGHMAAADPSSSTNPIPHSAETYSEILACALDGKL